jgi:hypothetical protein
LGQVCIRDAIRDAILLWKKLELVKHLSKFFGKLVAANVLQGAIGINKNMDVESLEVVKPILYTTIPRPEKMYV